MAQAERTFLGGGGVDGGDGTGIFGTVNIYNDTLREPAGALPPADFSPRDRTPVRSASTLLGTAPAPTPAPSTGGSTKMLLLIAAAAVAVYLLTGGGK